MAESLYNLAITKHTSEKPVEALVQEALELLGMPGDPYMEYKLSEALLFRKSGYILENLTLTESERYQQKLLSINIETLLQLSTKAQDNATGKPGEKQPSSRESQSEAGTPSKDKKNIFNKVKLGFRKKNAEKEPEPNQGKDELADILSKAIDEDTNETYQEAKPAPETPGIKQKHQPVIILVSIAAILATGIAAFFIFDEFSKTGTQVAETTTAPEQKKQEGTKKTVTTPPVEKLAAAQQPSTEGIKGKDTQQNRTETAEAVTLAKQEKPSEPASGSESAKAIAVAPEKPLPPAMPAIELKKLLAIVQVTKDQRFGDTESGQYEQHLGKLKRLLELDKPDLALVFAETADDAYSAALLILYTAAEEQKKKRTEHYDDMLLTMKNIVAKSDAPEQKPLLTAALSQLHRITNHSRIAEALLEQALQETDNYKGSTDQQVAWLTRMLIDHQHFSQQEGSRQLIAKLEVIATRLAAEENTAASARDLCTRLAAILARHGDMNAATEWIKRIPAENARQELLSQLKQL
ncbi:MAG: hypothetical protein R3F02_13700 [Thiolinea sp.]